MWTTASHTEGVLETHATALEGNGDGDGGGDDDDDGGGGGRENPAVSREASACGYSHTVCVHILVRVLLEDGCARTSTSDRAARHHEKVEKQGLARPYMRHPDSQAHLASPGLISKLLYCQGTSAL